jgi:hypothetical protein
MRIYGDPKRAKSNLRAGRERSRLAGIAFRGPALRPPAHGTLLRRIHVEDCLAGRGYTLELRQGSRRNAIEAWRYGKRVALPHGNGMDALFRFLRRQWALRWIVEN